MANASQLPSDLLKDFTASRGGRVTLVIGAGCSVEPPTNLPLSAEVSQQAHRRLRRDGELSSDCDDPENLSEVADAVFDKHGTQRPLVDRMNIQRFQNVQPNDGHLIAAALMREEAIAGVVTLNYDDAMSQAISRVGGSGEIQEIAGPEHHDQLGTVNLVYLHRKAGADPDNLIMRSDDLKKQWEDNWEEAIVRSQLVRASSVFAGLGSPADVLTESTKKIQQATGDGSSFYQVDPGDYEWTEDGQTKQSAFTEALKISERRYIQLGWCDFMKEVADRVRQEHIDQIREACVNEADRYQDLLPSTSNDEFDRLRERIKKYFHPSPIAYSFLELGKLRARWFLADSGTYFPQSREDVPDYIAQLLVAVDYVARQYNFDRVTFSPKDGCAIFETSATGRKVIAHLVHGRTRMAWKGLESRLPKDTDAQRNRTTQPTCVLGSGLRGQPKSPSTPRNIADPGPANEDPHADPDDETTPKITDVNPPVTQVEAFELPEQKETLDDIFGIHD